MEGKDFEFIPPAEILSIEPDTWWDSYTDETEGQRYYIVKYKCPKGLIYIAQTWARDELEAYTQVMRGETMGYPSRTIPK